MTPECSALVGLVDPLRLMGASLVAGCFGGVAAFAVLELLRGWVAGHLWDDEEITR